MIRTQVCWETRARIVPDIAIDAVWLVAADALFRIGL